MLPAIENAMVSRRIFPKSLISALVVVNGPSYRLERIASVADGDGRRRQVLSVRCDKGEFMRMLFLLLCGVFVLSLLVWEGQDGYAGERASSVFSVSLAADKRIKQIVCA